jgi:hypothetical protein
MHTNRQKQIISWIQKHGLENKEAFSRTFPEEEFHNVKIKWQNIWNPNLKKREWTQREDVLLFWSVLRNHDDWKLVSFDMKNRSEMSVKNRFLNSFKYKNFMPHKNTFRDIVFHSKFRKEGM